MISVLGGRGEAFLDLFFLKCFVSTRPGFLFHLGFENTESATVLILETLNL